MVCFGNLEIKGFVEWRTKGKVNSVSAISVHQIVMYRIQRMHFGKMYFTTYCSSPTCFGRTHDHNQGVSKDTNKTYNKLLTITRSGFTYTDYQFILYYISILIYIYIKNGKLLPV